MSEYVGEVVTVVAFLWVDIEEEGLVARGDTGERKEERKKEREVEKVRVGKKILFLVGGSRYGLSRFLLLLLLLLILLLFLLFFYSFGCSFFRTTSKDSFEGTSDTRNRLIL